MKRKSIDKFAILVGETSFLPKQYIRPNTAYNNHPFNPTTLYSTSQYGQFPKLQS